MTWAGKRPPPAAFSGATPCKLDDLEPGDFVKVGGTVKQVAKVDDLDVKTTDGRFYSPRNLQQFYKRRKSC